MLYHLIRTIEDHGDDIWHRLIRQVERDEHLSGIRRIPEIQLRDWLQSVALRLDQYVIATGGSTVRLRRDCTALGRTCFEEGIPIHEAIRTLQILKHGILELASEEGILRSSGDLYAQEQLRFYVSRLFDDLVYHTLLGYEEGLLKNVDARNAGRDRRETRSTEDRTQPVLSTVGK